MEAGFESCGNRCGGSFGMDPGGKRKKRKPKWLGNEGKIDIRPADGKAIFNMRFFREASN
jgi:hypothetical protein